MRRELLEVSPAMDPAYITADISKLVRLYALVTGMRTVSSRAIIDSADRAVRLIVHTYSVPVQTFYELSTTLKGTDFIDPLREFGEACREELQRLM